MRQAPSSSTQVASLDHVVLTVKSIAATVEFYTQHLGMEHEQFPAVGGGGARAGARAGTGKGAETKSQPSASTSTSSADGESRRHALRFGRQKINLHEAGHEFEPHAGRVQPGSADLCFLLSSTNNPVDGALVDRLRQAGVQVLQGLDLDGNADVSSGSGSGSGSGSNNNTTKKNDEEDDTRGGAIVSRTGARSRLRSIYIRDPDGNLIELSNEVE